jgi:hypothetical protein
MAEPERPLGDPPPRPLTDPPPRPQKDEWSERETVHSPVLSAQDAREGAVGHNVRYVLGFGVVAIVIVFFAIYLAYFA